MTDWMSKVVLFETVDELTDYKKKSKIGIKLRQKNMLGNFKKSILTSKNTTLKTKQGYL